MISQSRGVLGALALTTTWFLIEIILIWEMWGALMFRGGGVIPLTLGRLQLWS